MVLEHVLLLLEDLAIVQVTGLIELAVFAAIVLSFVLGSGQTGLVVLQTTVLLSELSSDEFFDLVDESDAALDLFFVDTRVLVGLILVVVHQLVKVAQVGLQSGPSGLH